MRMKLRKFTSKFKAQVAIEALKERESLTMLAKRFEFHPKQISAWKKEFLEHADQAFGGPFPAPEASDLELELEQLFRKIGELVMQRDF
jgi:transposase